MIKRIFPLLGLCALIIAAISGASYWSYHQGAQALRLKGEVQLEQAAANTQTATELAIDTVIQEMESWARQPVMVRILDQDPDHEIAALLEGSLRRFPLVASIECLSPAGKLLAWAGRANPQVAPAPHPEAELRQLQAGTRGIIRATGSQLVVWVPINWKFDQLEFLGVLKVTLAPASFLGKDHNWWTGLAAPRGALLTQQGSILIEQINLPAREMIFPGDISVVLRQRPVGFPAGIVGPQWRIVVAERYDSLFGAIDLLRRTLLLIMTLTATVLVVLVSVFAWRQRSLMLQLAAEATRLQATTTRLTEEMAERLAAEKELKQMTAHLQASREQLQEAHDGLEQRVAARTAELREEIQRRERAQKEAYEANQKLVVASRHAGMQEVATGVLHNVGNVLNSVNVSTSLLRDGLGKSKLPNLIKATHLLGDHAADAAVFLTSDPKGHRLPGYLIKLGEHLVAEQREWQQELDHLGKNIEHIKEIVTMQQSYARLAGVTENLNAEDLLEDALRMNDGALGRHGVGVVREYQKVPLVTVDKHKVLQILINLIRNAKHAADDSGKRDKRLTVVIRSPDERRVYIQVQDNGVGIAGENLARIFQHGFTTKKDGHGFGLHSSVNAAREMGGNLSVHSQGLGLGATFTLELPVARTAALAIPKSPAPPALVCATEP